MKTFLALLTAAILTGPSAFAVGFTDSNVHFYGEVRQIGGAQTVLLQSGYLEMTFVNQSNPANRVTLNTELRPTGTGVIKPFSYALRVPLAYLPEAPRIDEFLAVSASKTNFKIEEITINGTPATLPDGSTEFYSLSFASRANDYRLDLLVQGDSTDTDGDGLPDWWEDLYGLDPDLADASADLDDDGWSNLEEFLRGSQPTVSNRDPQLATAEVFVPESGEAGVYLQILDSDTADDAIAVEIAGGQGGFEVSVDGVPLASGEVANLFLADLQSGRLTIHHIDRLLSQFALPLSWNDGGDSVTGQVLVRVIPPSTRDGNDTTLWLDGMDLAASGQAIGVWADRSGNNRNATQPLPSHQPVVAGHSADFSVTNNAHLFFQDISLSSGDHTVLAAYRAAGSSDKAQTLLSSNRGFLQIAPTSQAISYPGAALYQMDGLAVRGFENVAGVDATSIFRREGSLLENVFGLSYDGQNIAAASIDPVLPTLGGRRSAIPGGADPIDDSFGGQLHELLVFPGALAEQKLRDVHDYLQSKWDGAIIWDLSTGLKAVSLTTSSANRQIIRGGHGDDHLRGGALDDILSGGPGNDVMTGGGGTDSFVFGGIDTGGDRITDYDSENDVIDLSAHFWGQSGDARQFISVRLDANFTTEIPTLDSVLIVQVPGGGTQEIVLENRVIGSTQLIELVGEGRIRMGGLSIPASVQVTLAPGAPAGESPDQPFDIVVTRSGAGVAAALDVPLGFFEEALGGRYVIDGATSNESHRSVISFARGETSRTLTVRPVPDLDTAGSTTVQVAVLPQYKYSVGGGSVARTITDHPMVWLEVVQANAVSDLAQPARLRVHRDGGLSQSLSVDLRLGGTAKEGVHIVSVAENTTIPAGQSSSEIQITALADGLAGGPKVVLFQLASSDRYQLGNPHEAVLYAAITEAEANGAGFDRWLVASTQGAKTCLGDLAGESKETVSRYLKAYAFGLESVAELGKHRVSFQVADGRPEISTHGTFKAADVRWGVESAATLGQWSNESGTFAEVPDPSGLKLVGDPLDPAETSRFYRLSMNLDPGVLASSSIAALTRASRTGISGNAAWRTDQASGDLVSSGSNAGETSRIIAEVGGGTTVDFEMKIAGAGAGDLLVFYIDGIKRSETTGGSVRVEQELTGASAYLLMWEFKRGSGNAVIRNLAP